MNIMSELVSMGESAGAGYNLAIACISLLLAFILGQASAWIYTYTHQGLSYSRAFVQSILLLTMIVCLAMMVIGSNIVIAFGLIGALSVIRFRNILKDTRDTAFIFFALIMGMATGTGPSNYPLAILGAIIMYSTLLYLHWAQFGSRQSSDGFLRFNIGASDQGMQSVTELLNNYCRQTFLVSQRFQETGVGEIAYRLIMRDPTRGDELVESLQQITGIQNVTFVVHEDQAEV